MVLTIKYVLVRRAELCLGVGWFKFEDTSNLSVSLDGIPAFSSSASDNTTNTAAIVGVGGKYYFTDNVFALLNVAVTIGNVEFNDETLCRRNRGQTTFIAGPLLATNSDYF